MEVQRIARCAGLDVHKDTIVACRRQTFTNTIRNEVESFGTTTAELLRLSEWLSEKEITHVVMESTGVYWRPVWNILHGDFELIVANPEQVKAIRGRKTDVKDAKWLAELLANGQVDASFVPEQPIQDLRLLTRTHKQLTRERVAHVQRIQKVLQTCNIRLDSVLSEIHGVSGMKVLDAIIAGETDPAKLASLVGKVKASREQLVSALHGRVNAAARAVLRLHVDEIRSKEKNLRALESTIDELLIPFAEAVALIETIPGVGHATACVIVAEIGVDMTRFPTPGHLVSWAGLCPEMNESAGKRRSNKLRKGNPWLKTALCQVGWAAVRRKQRSYLHDLFYRVKSRSGPKKSVMAVAASILTSIHAMLTNKTEYHELGFDYRLKLNEQRSIVRHTRALAKLGYSVELSRAA